MECKLEDIFEFIRNGANIKQGHIDGGYPITRIETISNSYIDTSKVGYAGVCELGKFKDYLLKDGDILMSHINSEKHLGKTAIYENINEDIIHGMNLLCLRPNITKVVPKYINYYFNTKCFKIKLPKITKKSVNQASFSVNDLKNLYVYIPSLERQKKVANVLDKAQSLIDKRKVQIEALDELVKSRFIEMFGEPKNNPNSYEMVPFDKVIKYIGDIGSNGANSTISANLKMTDTEDYALMVRTLNFTSNDFENNVKYVSKEVYEFFKKSKIFGGELIFNKIGSAGINFIMPYLNKPVSLGLNQIMVRTNEMINMVFLHNLLNTEYGKHQINRRVQGAVTKSITKGAIKEIPILLPPIELQKQFADFVKQVDKLKFEMEKSLRELEDNFNSLMQRAFKGEV
ncbi:restriction endonuclease subunit S [Clostridium sporogenes]|uniref:restriction endonuclease subunit S n=1 Tax=Clostridium sporogenes TaxID=1509 RepID=UPI002238D502|nr:restriction endonuclease subunit S [Clostridium sporogenes]EKS4343890.1 restriction endonuclease subunit S [Clostridium botulinum]EKS4396222.1 restriction endonuclease subunit S [Clostridium botulinum]MCW6078133.1 restriction endonuclease subunit S [Clostridium sporogenes]